MACLVYLRQNRPYKYRVTLSRTYRLWVEAMRREGFLRSVPALVVKSAGLALYALLSLPLVPGRLWRARMRSCFRCPIFNRQTYQCRDGEFGCGCLMPLKARFRRAQCWAREEGIANLGWPPHLS